MATPVVSDQSSRNIERVCQDEVSHQEHPDLNLPRPAANNRVVGFDCEFVERPPKAFQVDCPVCLLVVREPQQVTCCGYSFCQPCINRVQRDKKPCPTCNEAEFFAYPNKGLQRAIYEYQVLCGHQKLGCQWVGELGELDEHLNENPILGRQFVGCEFVEVECNDCGKSFQRQHFKAHQLEQHPFSCEYCHNYESYYEDVVKNHWPVCGSYPVPCPNECGVYPERQNLEHHVNKDCPLTVVNCDFHYAGCEVQLPRSNMPTHLAENLVPHMAQLATYNQKKVQEKDQQILQLTEDLRKEMVVNRQKIDQLERENEDLSKSLLEKKEEIAQLKEGLRAKDKATTEEIAELRENTRVKENLKQESESLKQQIAELRQKHDADVNQKEEATKLGIAQLAKKCEASIDDALKATTEKIAELLENSRVKEEALKQEIAHLRQKQNDALSNMQKFEEATKQQLDFAVSKGEASKEALKQEITQLKKGICAKEETMKQETELLKQEITQLQQKQDDSLKEEIIRLQDHMRQEIVELKQEQQESENNTIAQLKTVHEDVQKRDETLQCEVVVFRRMHEDAISRSEIMKQEIGKIQDENENLTVQIRKLQEEIHTNEEMRQAIFEVRRKETKTDLIQPTVPQELHMPDDVTLNTPPVEFTMTDFEKHKQNNDVWESEPFYTHPRGYKLRLQVFANGRRSGQNTHVSVGVCLMRGNFDDHLNWPFTGRVSVMLLNQKDQKNNECHTLHLTPDTSHRVIVGESLQTKVVWSQFISHSRLGHNPAQNCQFLKDNCLHFRVTQVVIVDKTSTPLQRVAVLEKNQLEVKEQCLAIESRVCVTPFQFTMKNFEQLKADKVNWYSPSFYTHPHGYRMCLNVDTKGYGIGEGTHVSVHVCLMRGEWDNYLKWPFRGDISIQLLNQIEDKEHHAITISFTDNTPDTSAGRETSRDSRAAGYGQSKFISHQALNYNEAKNCQYLKYDCLQFQITKVELKH